MDFSFEERLNNVLDDRKQTPWGKSLGFTSASISHIFSGGRIPGPEFLQAICRAENVNLNWLLSGKGKPFNVTYLQSAEDFVVYVNTMLTDENWQVCVCSLSEQTVLVLTQPAQYEFKGKWIDYTLCEVLVGQGSEKLAWMLNHHQNERDTYSTPNLPSNILKKIARGELGTYALLHHPDYRLENWIQSTPKESLEYEPETSHSTPISVSLMRSVVKLVDQCEKETKQNLDSDQKARVITAVYRQAEKLGLSEEEISSAIETSFDVLKD
ncbi:helix-turn-helix domain-containing protein [Vibrio fluvialis]|nr:helix-turn-helix domain-containing protein [Vibrio fluvialis]